MSAIIHCMHVVSYLLALPFEEIETRLVCTRDIPRETKEGCQQY